MTRRVRGRVVLDEGDPPVRGDLHVWVEDVTMADAPATRIASLVLAGVTLVPGDATGVAFALDTPPRPVGRRWAVRALLDRDGDGRTSPGDCVNVVRCPFPEDGAEVTLRVRRVG